MGKYYLGQQAGSQTNFSVVDGTGVVSDLALSGLYLSLTGKSADADLLDGQDSVYYRNVANITGLARLSGYFTGDFTGYARVDSILFNTGTTGAATTPVGELEWADDLGGLKLGLKGGNLTHFIGQQLFERVINKTTGTLDKGTVVFVSGAQGNRISVQKAIANADPTSATTFGIVAENILVDQEGFVVREGLLQGLNTTGFSEGAPLWLSPTVSGSFSSVKPIAPDHGVLVGFCVRSHATVGEVLVKVQNGYEIEELHDVRVLSPQNGQFLAYNSASGVWYNVNLTGGANISVTSNGGSLVSISTVSGTYTGSLTGTASNALQLNGLPGAFYRDAGNLTGTLFVDITGTFPNSDKLNNQSGSYYLNYANFTGTANASGIFSGIFRSNASTTTTAAVNLPHGTAPTSPVNGDLWTTTSGLYVYINGSTVGPLTTGGGGGGAGTDEFARTIALFAL